VLHQSEAGHRRTTLEKLIEDGDPAAPAPPWRDGRATIFTSGTTGMPKGASRGSARTTGAAREHAMVPVMLQRILELPTDVRHRYDTSSLQTVPVSGSALPGALATRFMDEYGDVLYNLYGTTEVASATRTAPAR